MTEQQTERHEPEEALANDPEAGGLRAAMLRFLGIGDGGGEAVGADRGPHGADLLTVPDEGDEGDDAIGTESEGGEDALSMEEREELTRLRAEREADAAEKARMAAALRDRAVGGLLDRFAAPDMGDGREYAMPKAQRDAAEAVIDAMAGAGCDPVSMGPEGEARLQNTAVGEALATLLTPWRPIERGQRGTAHSEGEEYESGFDRDDARVKAVMAERGLAGPKNYAAVAEELAARGEIRGEG